MNQGDFHPLAPGDFRPPRQSCPVPSRYIETPKLERRQYVHSRAALRKRARSCWRAPGGVLAYTIVDLLEQGGMEAGLEQASDIASGVCSVSCVCGPPE